MKERVKFSQPLFDEICARLMEGETLRSISRKPEMPVASTILEWKSSTPELSEQYARAREIGYLLMSDDIIDIAGRKAEPGEDLRLQVDSRKWLLSKALPKIYGDKTSLDARVTMDWAAVCEEAAAQWNANPPKPKNSTD